MFLRRTGSSICRLSDPVKPVKPVALSDTTKGPVSPLERNPQSPKGWKNRESDGIGLGIVAALEKSGKIRYVSNPLGIQNHRDEVTCKSTFGRKKDSVFFCGSPPAREDRDLRSFRVADFLSCCYLCRKRLHGKDIYMYRGEKAFCSIECRYQQITSDEFHEKCGSEAMRTSDNAMRLSYTDERRLFFMGITAA